MFPMVVVLQHAQAGSSTMEDHFSFIVAFITLHSYVTSLNSSLRSIIQRVHNLTQKVSQNSLWNCDCIKPKE
jgi:hypothetical protein